MIQILMPDPLIWQAGAEYGLQALSALPGAEHRFLCYLANKGPRLEAVAFAVRQLQLAERVRFTGTPKRFIRHAQVILLPRVAPLEHETIWQALQLEKVVITSDPGVQFEHPNLVVFNRRHWQSIARLIMYLLQKGRLNVRHLRHAP